MALTSVRIMQCAFADTGQLKIGCIGVGVGVIVYSASKKAAVGLHILAAHSSTPNPDNPAKFANSAIPYALDLLKKEGVSPPFSVTIAGGAAMTGSSLGSSMGSKVVEAVKESLAKANLHVKQDETGGSKIQTMLLEIMTGEISIT